MSDIQVFAPVYRGELGIDALNLALREALNPDGRPVRGGRLRIGDKLMMTGRNLHDLGLMNGTLLRLLDETSGEDDDAALLLSGEEGVFRLPPEEAERLLTGLRVLGPPRSGHRAPGRGNRRPRGRRRVLPAPGDALHGGDPRPAGDGDRGDEDVIARAVRTPDTGRRHSRLAERLA